MEPSQISSHRRYAPARKPQSGRARDRICVQTAKGISLAWSTVKLQQRASEGDGTKAKAAGGECMLVSDCWASHAAAEMPLII